MRFIFLLLFPILAFGTQHIPPKGEVWDGPWFLGTGPLLAPSATTNPMGETSWQPYLFIINNFGEYDQHWNRQNTPNFWTISPLVNVTYGLSSFMDIEADFSFSYNLSEGSSAVRFNDSNLFLGFQVLRDTRGTAIPNLRITIQQVFPFGQYDKLNPKKHGTDATGRGAYQTGLNFNFEKLFLMAPEQFFRLRWSVGYLFAVPVHIRGESVYGGAPGTRGKAYPGQTLTAFLSGEYTITHRWVFACDSLYILTRSDRFSGKRGTTSDGEKASVGNPVSQQISLAPAIEYNWSENFGMIGGVWFSLAGKNAPQFFSVVYSVVINY